jgi:hypothetical protein
MTDHEPDARLMCRVYLSGIALGLAIFALGFWVGLMF